VEVLDARRDSRGRRGQLLIENGFRRDDHSRRKGWAWTGAAQGIDAVSTKIHLRTNANGEPLTFDVTAGETHEVKGYEALIELHDVAPDRFLGDKGYDSDAIRADLTKRGVEPVIPPRSNRKTPIEYDHEAYKRRNLVERCVNRLKPLSWLAKCSPSLQ
jgi:transposase